MALPSLGVVVSVLAVAGVAVAQYPPAIGSGRVSRSTVKQCQCTLFSGDGFVPGETVTVTDNGSAAGTVAADRRGEFRLQVCFDAADPEGRHDLRARGASREVAANVEVRGSACRGGGSGNLGRLPRTGTATAAAALLTGFGLVTTGSAAVYAARRRRRTAAA